MVSTRMSAEGIELKAIFSTAGIARVSAAVAGTCAVLWSVPAEARIPKCTGTNLMPILRQQEPDLIKRVMAAAARIPNGQAVLWKIERQGRAPSHLFGTIHVSDVRVATLSENVRTAIHNSQTVAVEIKNASTLRMGKLIAANPKRFMALGGNQLEQKLSRDEHAIALKFIRGMGIPDQAARVLQPWFINLLLSAPACERNRAAQGYSVLDRIVSDEARNRGIELVGLETIDEQFNALSSFSEKTQLGLLRTSIAFARKMEDYFETLIQLYQRRQINVTMPLSIEIARSAGLDTSPLKTFEAKLAIKRNYIMRDRALPLLAKGRAFIAVGSLHLVGKEGLVALFRQAGYRVTAVE